MIERRGLPHSRIAATKEPVDRMDRPTGGPPAQRLARTSMATTTSESVLTIMWRSRWIVLLSITVALTSGLVYISAATPIYTSTAKLYLDYESIQISRYEPGEMPRTEKYLHTQAEVLRSRNILAAALGTEEDPSLETFRNTKIPLAYLRKTLVVDVGRKDEIISVSFSSPYPIEAAQVVNRVVEAYLASRSENEQKDTTKALRILEGQLTMCKNELKAKRAELWEFQANHMPVSLGMGERGVAMQGYLGCQSDHAQAQARTSKAKLQLDGIRALADNPTALRQYVHAEGLILQHDNTVGEQASLEAQLTELDLRRAKLLERLTENHPAVVTVDTEKKQIREELTALADEFTAATIMAAERRYVEAQADELRLAEQHAEQSAEVRQLSTELRQSEQLQAEVDRLDASVATFEREVGEVRKLVGEDVGRMKMAALEPALPAEKPSAPQKGRIMAMALILGLVLGGGIAVTRDWADQTFRSAEEMSAALDLAVLGVVPAMPRRQNERLRGQKVLVQPDSPAAEAFRTVRTAVFFGTSTGLMRTLLVTSPAAGDGKSTLVSNLSIAMAQAGQNTLVLDADLRKPTQHSIFDMDPHERCVGNVFAGQMRLSEAIQPTQVKGLSLLTCGYGVSNPAEFLNSPQFAKLLECLAKTYDRVLIDAPPVTVVTDAQILGALCDFTVLVLNADKSTIRIARRAVDALASVGANLVGVVVNGVRHAGGGYGYYGKCYRSYGSDSRNGGNGQGRGAKATVARDRRTAARLAEKVDVERG